MTKRGDVVARRDELRAAILAAADARVAATGLRDLGVREIAQEAGCSSGMVYKLFASHDDLVLAVNANTLQALSDRLAERLRGIDDPADALSAMADAYLDYAAANTPRWDTLFTHRQSGGAMLPAWYAEVRDRLLDGIGSTIGVAPPNARTLFSAVHGVVALGLAQKVGSVSLDALRAELRALMTAIAGGMAHRQALATPTS